MRALLRAHPDSRSHFGTRKSHLLLFVREVIIVYATYYMQCVTGISSDIEVFVNPTK